MDLLIQAAVFFAAAVFIVPLFKRFGLGAVLGYLIAGAAIGPSGLSLVGNTDQIMHIAEFGVVLLLFIIGLELQPQRLWTMRNAVFGLGGAQVIATAVVVGASVAAIGFEPDAAIVIGLGLALSSTAYALQFLAERHELATRHGRSAFAVLLFQDIAAIPILAIVPLMGAGAAVAAPDMPAWLAVLRVIGVILVVILGGNYLLRPFLRAIASTEIRELFTAAALLIVTAVSILMSLVGVSMALGAFLAGMLLANSEYRHELEADIEPFKGLLLGLFFITVGMGLNLGLLIEQPFAMTLFVLALLGAKGLVIYLLARGWSMDPRSAKDLAITVAQGGEFAFVIFAAAVTAGVMTPSQDELLVLVVSLSMALSPLIALTNDFLTKRFSPKPAPAYEAIPDDEPPVIIAGFGRFGQIVGRILAARKIPFTALDISAEQVDFVKRFGNKVYYGDASRIDMLRAAGAEKAKVIVVAIDDVEANVRTAETVKKHFPHLNVFARARNRQHAYRLMDVGVTHLHRETFLSSIETARDVLTALGMTYQESERTVRAFQRHDEARLAEHYTHHTDDQKMQDLAKAAIKELEEMFERDAAEQTPSNSDQTG